MSSGRLVGKYQESVMHRLRPGALGQFSFLKVLLPAPDMSCPDLSILLTLC